MILLNVFWNLSLLWWVILPALVASSIILIRTIKKHGDGPVAVASGVLTLWMALQGFTCIMGTPEWRTKALKDEMDQKAVAQEERYYNVTFLGKKPVEQNPSDGRYYINMGNGQMVGYHEVMAMGKCRACDQFKNSDSVDSVYAYKVYRSASSWLNDPFVFFSKRPDIVIEAAMIKEVK